MTLHIIRFRHRSPSGDFFFNLIQVSKYIAWSYIIHKANNAPAWKLGRGRGVCTKNKTPKETIHKTSRDVSKTLYVLKPVIRDNGVVFRCH